MSKNLWFLTEERPKKKVIEMILKEFSKDYGFAIFIDIIRILPILENSKFTFTYKVSGFLCNQVDKVFIKTVSGYSSFIDFLIFYQEKKPESKDIPIYAIEETKTDDKESRNTSVYQRCSKFVFIENFYPKIRKIMLYNLHDDQKQKKTYTYTDTYIFGIKLLHTLNVKILGKKLDSDETDFAPFKNIDDIICFKKSMRMAPKSNITISIKKLATKIQISGKLCKNNNLSHDPNIGALSAISAVLRKFEWKGEIEIIDHGLSQKMVSSKNKFVKIANKLNISFQNLTVPEAEMNKCYWKYDTEGEKLCTIFIHLVVENFAKGNSIFENHAGCERGYFIPLDDDPIPIKKYTDRKKYKAGDKSKMINIPDLVLLDKANKIIIDIEGKKYKLRTKGIKQLEKYENFDRCYNKHYYPSNKIIRTVVLYGSQEEKIVEIQISFILNENGKLILGIEAPKLFQKAIKNLLDFWK